MPYRRLYLHGAALLFAVASAPAGAQSMDSSHTTGYVPGQGFDLPLGFRGGGYINIIAEDLRDQDAALTPEALSLFLFRNFGYRWHLFSEIELGEPFDITRKGIGTGNAEADLERLYVDYDLGSRIAVRVGKYLTPIGRWNLIHADPLIWTVSRPLTTTAPFPNHATGLMVHGSLPIGSTDLDYSIYGDASDALDPTPNDEKTFPDIDRGINPINGFENALGARVQYRSFDERLQIGLSLAHFRRVEGPAENLVGTDWYWSIGRAQLSGEAVYRAQAGHTGPDEWGGFLQAVVPIPGTQRFYLVGYHERFKAAEPDITANINSLGITFVPHPAVKIKLEHRGGQHNGPLAPDGWFASFAMLL